MGFSESKRGSNICPAQYILEANFYTIFTKKKPCAITKTFGDLARSYTWADTGGHAKPH